MKPIQLILIAVAVVCAVGAGLMVMNLNNQPAPVVVQQNAPKAPVVKVLVARENIPMGNALTMENLQWQEWPESGIREGFISDKLKPEAMKEYEKTIARSSFFAGEPIREEKIVRSESGYLSAILPAGKRAVAIQVEAETSAGGFILPNDYVDIIMSFRSTENQWVTETILENIRVLAIDQVIEEQDGEKAKVGNTATLELTPEQTQIISVSSRISGNKLMLALRSVEDSAEGSESKGASHLLNSGNKRAAGTIRLIRFGSTKEIRPKK